MLLSPKKLGCGSKGSVRIARLCGPVCGRICGIRKCNQRLSFRLLLGSRIEVFLVTTGMKRWLILTQYYAPEIGAPQIRLRSVARELQRHGIQVTVLTALPNYPVGKIF